MVSLAILIIVLVALAYSYMVLMRHNAYLAHKKEALEIAQKTIDTLTKLDYNHELLGDRQREAENANAAVLIDSPYRAIKNSDGLPLAREEFYLLDDGAFYQGGEEESRIKEGDIYYDPNTDINNEELAQEIGIDHPNADIDAQVYNDIIPPIIGGGSTGYLTYYRLWSIEEQPNWKKILVVVYWFEENDPSNPANHKFISLKTEKRRLLQ